MHSAMNAVRRSRSSSVRASYANSMTHPPALPSPSGSRARRTVRGAASPDKDYLLASTLAALACAAGAGPRALGRRRRAGAGAGMAAPVTPERLGCYHVPFAPPSWLASPPRAAPGWEASASWLASLPGAAQEWEAGLVTQEVQTVRGPVSITALGRVFMHEHVFLLNEEIRQNYESDWDEEQQVAAAAAKLSALERRGVATIVDPTVVGLGRNIPRIQRVAASTGINIIVATGLYTYNDVPFYFRYRSPHSGTGGADPMTDLFVADLTEGIAGTGVRAASLKCCIDDEGLSAGVERVMRAVARAHVITGAPVMVHTHPATQSGLEALRVLTEEGADPSRVIMAHSGDTGDLDYLMRLADAGCLLGMDRFGLDIVLPFEERVATVAALAARGYADRMVLAHDVACHIDWFPAGLIDVFAPNWHLEHLLDDVLPALREQGVTDEQIDTMLVDNPRRYFAPRISTAG